RPRAEISGVPPVQPRQAESPSLSPAQGGRTGWLSELLTRASREEMARFEPPPPPPQASQPARDHSRRPARADRTNHSAIDSLDSLAVDIARMTDHDVAADVWDRYKRGERNVFTRRLYTPQGQRAFDEIQRKYQSD